MCEPRHERFLSRYPHACSVLILKQATHPTTCFPVSIPIAMATCNLKHFHRCCRVLPAGQRCCKRRRATMQASRRCYSLHQTGGGHGHRCCEVMVADAAGRNGGAAQPWPPVMLQTMAAGASRRGEDAVTGVGLWGGVVRPWPPVLQGEAEVLQGHGLR
ncbi:hypothetical protein BRADI_4g14975v3 [Brachypodium distachyon]|uniref:Uncharacterized protein n=1 Tax=Brachypodium distachyon TaxID=15368 RepID=A0A2K2CMX7_BRADI|nr:hypothetical protein BRADI_4g14975v3 [Brachypodium distachyon]